MDIATAQIRTEYVSRTVGLSLIERHEVFADEYLIGMIYTPYGSHDRSLGLHVTVIAPNGESFGLSRAKDHQTAVDDIVKAAAQYTYAPHPVKVSSTPSGHRLWCSTCSRSYPQLGHYPTPEVARTEGIAAHQEHSGHPAQIVTGTRRWEPAPLPPVDPPTNSPYARTTPDPEPDTASANRTSTFNVDDLPPDATDREITAAKALDAIESEPRDTGDDPNNWLRRYTKAYKELQAAKRAANRPVVLTVVRTYGPRSYVR